MLRHLDRDLLNDAFEDGMQARKGVVRLLNFARTVAAVGAAKLDEFLAVLGKLAKARINVTAVDGVSAGGGRFGAIIWVKRKDIGRAARALGA